MRKLYVPIFIFSFHVHLKENICFLASRFGTSSTEVKLVYFLSLVLLEGDLIKIVFTCRHVLVRSARGPYRVTRTSCQPMRRFHLRCWPESTDWKRIKWFICYIQKSFPDIEKPKPLEGYDNACSISIFQRIFCSSGGYWRNT